MAGTASKLIEVGDPVKDADGHRGVVIRVERYSAGTRGQIEDIYVKWDL